MDAIETFKVDDKTVEIHIDDNPINPRDPQYQDNCDMFICFHKRYSLGDKHDYSSEHFNGWDDMEKQIVKDLDPLEIRRLYMLDHSGLTISSAPFDCPWDSGMIGFVLITKEQARKACMVKKITKKTKEWATKYLDATIKEYDSYLRGESYGYYIKDADGEVLESCWGFGGDIDYVRETATETAKEIKVAQKEDPNQLQLFLYSTPVIL
jgi:hypothetical protein